MLLGVSGCRSKLLSNYCQSYKAIVEGQGRLDRLLPQRDEVENSFKQRLYPGVSSLDTLVPNN